eukprot:8645728-Alexandrium_andersonii.AAC.1
MCIPLALHGDGVPVSGVGKAWSKSLDVYSWCSLLGKGCTVQSNYIIVALFTKLAVQAGPMCAADKFFK